MTDYQSKSKDDLIKEIEILNTKITEFEKFKIADRLTQKQLKSSLDIQNAILSATDVLIAYMDMDFNFIIVNQAYADAGKMSREDFIGKNHFSLFPNAENESIFKKVVETGEMVTYYKKSFEYISQPERGITYWNWSLIPLKDESDAIQTLVLSCHEATNIVEAESEVLKSEEKFRTFAKYNNSWDYWINPIGDHLIYISPSCERITGYTAKEFYQNIDLLYEIVHPDDISILKNHKQKILHTDIIDPIEYRITNKDKEELWISHVCQIVYDNNGVNIGIRGSNRDITKQKRAEKELLESQNLLNYTQHLTKVGGWKYNLESQSMFWTDETYHIHEINPDEIEAGSKSHIYRGVECYNEDDRQIILDAFQKCVDEGISYDLEFPFTTVKGKKIWIRTIAQPEIENNKVVNVIGNMMDITDRKQEEAELSKKQYYLSKSQELGKIGTWELDIIKNELIWTEETYNIFNVPIGTKMNLEFVINLVHPDDKEYVTKKWNDALKHKPTGYDIEHRIIVNNKIKHIREKAHIKFNKDGNATYAIGFAQDITDRTSAELKVKESEEQLNSYINSATDSFMLLDSNFNLVILNDTALKKFGNGTQKDNITGKNITLLLPEIEDDGKLDKFKNVLKTGEPCSFDEITYDQNRGNRVLYTKAFIVGSGLGIISSDITERVKREDELARYSRIIESSLNEIYLFDANTLLFTQVNNAARDNLGYTMDELRKISPLSIKPEFTKNSFNNLIAPLLKGEKEEVVFETIHIRKDKTLYNVEIHLQLLKFKQESLFGAIVLNITERKRTEVALKKSEQKLKNANATKDKFFSIIAHDLRSPFNSIIGFSELLLETHAEYDDINRGKLIEPIVNSGKETLELLDDLLKWAKSQSNEISFNPETYNLEDIFIKLLQENLAKANNKEIQLAYVLPKQIDIFADFDMLNTILRNLLSNAIKFTHENGSVKIFAEQDENNVIISVNDTGVGISKEKQQKIFDITEKISTTGTRDEKGSGLGLILCKEFVDKHHGKIWVESIPKKGSTWFFSIPAGTKKQK